MIRKFSLLLATLLMLLTACKPSTSPSGPTLTPAAAPNTPPKPELNPVHVGNFGPELEPQQDKAVECLRRVTVRQFQASQKRVQPFESTTLRWNVELPGGCPIQLHVANKRVAAVGQLQVTPVHSSSLFALVGTMAGVVGTLATQRIEVDVRPGTNCRSQEIAGTIIQQGIRNAVTAAMPDIDPRTVAVTNTARDVLIVVPTARKFGFGGKLTTALRFVVGGGNVDARYTLFHPEGDAPLGNRDINPLYVLLVEKEIQKLYDRAEALRKLFSRGFTALTDNFERVGERLFELETREGFLQAVYCNIEVPTLETRLSVQPAADPGRFDLRVDGRNRATAARDGASTGKLRLDEGAHRVAAVLSNGQAGLTYATTFSGDCNSAGRVTLSPGDAKVCQITQVRRSTEDCRAACRASAQTCDPPLKAQDCANILAACLAKCG